MNQLRLLVIMNILLLILSCSEETNFTVVKTDGELPIDFDLCFADNLGECEKDEQGNNIATKTITYNTCNETSVIRVKAMGQGIDEYTPISFYLRGARFYGDDLDTGVCSREDIFCYCPREVDNIDQNLTIEVIFNDKRSNELDLTLRKREEIIETYNFSAEVIFISDYMCNPIKALQPHINLFNFQDSIWNDSFNFLDNDLNSFMPVIFSEGESKTFGTTTTPFVCANDLFEFNNNQEAPKWCVAVEDWFCGHSDQDYDYLMTYETESLENEGKLRLTFRPVSHFGAKNYHTIKFTFATNETRELSFEINKQIGNNNWQVVNAGELILNSYIEEADGRFSYEFSLPSGVTLFQNTTAEAFFSIVNIEE